MWQYVGLVFCIGIILGENTNKYRDVTIAQGKVRGRWVPEEGVFTFYNIPYATAPTGRNKFKAPLDPPVWMHTFEAVDRGIACPQPGGFPIMEDCLVANIFVPDTDSTNIPVLVNVHGGAYQRGFGNSAKLNNLVQTKRLIVVTFNYRLGAHGFLCLGSEDAAGNAGLKDQVALLRWVQTNIASFGGNPNDVTLLGCSAGGGSVDILTISGLTTGLFKRAIVNSGVAFGAVGVQTDPLVNAQNYAKLLGFSNVDDIDALEEFYKTVSFDTIFSKHYEIRDNKNAVLIFAPCVETDVGEERILADAPINIIRQGNYNKIPLLYGFANMEGLMRLASFDTWKNEMNENFSEFLPVELYFENEADKENIARTLKSFYFDDKLVSEETIEAYIDYFTDVLFGYPMLKALSTRMNSLNDTIYLYEYSFVDEHSPEIPHTDVKGANHCDQSRAIIDTDKSNVTEEYIRMKAIMREYWLNFIWTGSPWTETSDLVRWPPANADRTPHMSLGSTIELKGILLEKRAALWDSIYEKHYRAPMPPRSSGISLIISKFILTCSVLFHLIK